VEIKKTLIEFHGRLLHYRETITHLDSALSTELKAHSERASKLTSLIDSGRIMDHLAHREMAHKKGLIRSKDNYVDSELEGLRKYVDILEETHRILHGYLELLTGMKEILEAYEKTIAHSHKHSVRSLTAQIEVISHQIRSENSIVHEEEILIHNLTHSIAEIRGAISHIFSHEHEHMLHDDRTPIGIIKGKFHASDLKMRKIAGRVNSHNHLVRHHITTLINETAKLIRDYDSLQRDSHHDLRKAA
jgi:hypothetical protein